MRVFVAECVSARRGAVRGILAVAAFVVGAATAVAQGYDCDRLRAQIAAAAPSKGSAQAMAAAQKQQDEADKATFYARSIGCDNRQFLMFGSPPPPQCPALEAQIRRLRGAAAESRARAQSGGGNRQALMANYDAACRGPRGLFDSLFGDERRQVPIEDASPVDAPEIPDDGDKPRNGPLAVCVRTCDGGYFPVSYSARPSRYYALEDLCKAQCPGADAALYTMSASGDIDSAVSINGEPYSELKNADKFRKAFDPKCGCKPPNQSWVQALAQAEETLDKKFPSDVIVTQEKSDELQRVKGAALSPDKIRGILRGASPSGAAKDDKTVAVVASPPDDSAAGQKTPPPGKADSKDDKKVRVVGPKLLSAP